jgi:hypothetical protein
MPSQGHKFPGISTLLVHERMIYLGGDKATLQVLNSLRRRPMIFPHLSELHLFDYHLTMEIAQAIQDVLLLRKDTHLTTRMPEDVAVLQFLRDHVPNLKVYYPFVIQSLVIHSIAIIFCPATVMQRCGCGMWERLHNMVPVKGPGVMPLKVKDLMGPQYRQKTCVQL